MKKLIAGGLLALLLLGMIGGSALAADNTPTTAAPWTAPWANLTDKQKAELAELQKQMLSVREKLIDKYVEYKWITPQQGQYLKDRIALQKKYAGEFGWGPGFGMRGGRGGRGFGARGFGAGMMGGYRRGFAPGYNPATATT
ncbi:MAG: DUF2680 domain-containing protein [Bacillota bacterium]|nr:DUF2680 domain-containing protein [Bacillota bacterium]